MSQIVNFIYNALNDHQQWRFHVASQWLWTHSDLNLPDLQTSRTRMLNTTYKNTINSNFPRKGNQLPFLFIWD